MKEKENLLEEFFALCDEVFPEKKSNEYCDKLIAEVRIKERLINEILKFMKDHQITCKESIYQCDDISFDSSDFISKLFEIVKPFIEEDK